MSFNQLRYVFVRTCNRGFHFQCTKRASSQNHYEVLGLSPTASNKDIKEAFFKKSKQYHPDANSGDKKAVEEVIKINQAYDVLKNSKSKHSYDRLLQGKKGFSFEPASADKNKDQGKKSPFLDTSQEYYQYPTFYTDPILKFEAERVWEYRNNEEKMEAMHAEARNMDPKDKRRMAYWWIFICFFLPSVLTYFIFRRSRKTQSSGEQQEETLKRMKENMPDNVYFHEQSGTFRMKNNKDSKSSESMTKDSKNTTEINKTEQINLENMKDLTGK